MCSKNLQVLSPVKLLEKNLLRRMMATGGFLLHRVVSRNEEQR